MIKIKGNDLISFPRNYSDFSKEEMYDTQAPYKMTSWRDKNIFICRTAKDKLTLPTPRTTLFQCDSPNPYWDKS